MEGRREEVTIFWLWSFTVLLIFNPAKFYDSKIFGHNFRWFFPKSYQNINDKALENEKLTAGRKKNKLLVHPQKIVGPSYSVQADNRYLFKILWLLSASKLKCNFCHWSKMTHMSSSSYLLPKFSRGPQKLAKLRVFKVDYFDFPCKKIE